MEPNLSNDEIYVSPYGKWLKQTSLEKLNDNRYFTIHFGDNESIGAIIGGPIFYSKKENDITILWTLLNEENNEATLKPESHINAEWKDLEKEGYWSKIDIRNINSDIHGIIFSPNNDALLFSNNKILYLEANGTMLEPEEKSKDSKSSMLLNNSSKTQIVYELISAEKKKLRIV